MNRLLLLKIVNPILGIAFVAQVASGVMMEKGVSVETTREIHEIGAWVLVVCACLHVVLNWNWIRNAFFSRKTVSQAPGPQE